MYVCLFFSQMTKISAGGQQETSKQHAQALQGKKQNWDEHWLKADSDTEWDIIQFVKIASAFDEGEKPSFKIHHTKTH